MKKLLLIFLVSFSLAASAQLNIPLNREYFYRTEAHALKNDSTVTHVTFKPVITSQASLFKRHEFHHEFSGYKVCKRSKFKRKLFNESLIIVNKPGFYLTIDPLFNLEAAKSNIPAEDSILLYRNTRGLRVEGKIGDNFAFASTFYENQAVYTEYISDFVDSLGVAPGQGRVKQFKTNGYDFAMSSGYISYDPSEHINLQFGHGKHFVGDGYRSMLLSDNSFNYPYVRITSTFGKKKFQYVNLYTVFMNLDDGGVITPPHTERLFQKKAGAFQMLTYVPHQRIHLGLFQGMIWEASDNKNRHHLNAGYFNPVIGLSAIPYGLDRKNNIIFGATLKAKITKYVYAYSQFALDDIAEDRQKGSLSNKTAWQAGFKAFNLFTVEDLYLQAEYNSARPYTYAHRRPEQSYTHYSQPLAHPLGANFNEAVGILGYRFTRVFAEIKVNYATVGKDSAGYHFGNDPLTSDNFAYYGVSSTVNEHLQGSRTTITNKDLRIGVIINPATNMNLVLGVSMRDLKNAAAEFNTEYYYVALRTSLSNIYYDF